MKKRGRGIACMWFGIGKTGVTDLSRVRINIDEDGMINLFAGAADIGQGSDTVFAQIAAEVLDVPLEKVNVLSGDTMLTPDSGVTSATRQTFITGNAARLAAEQLKTGIIEAAAKLYEVDKTQVSYSGGEIYIGPDKNVAPVKDLVAWCAENEFPLSYEHSYCAPTVKPDEDATQGKPYATYAFGTQVAEVEVDTLTGFVKVLGIYAVHDVGKAINPSMAKGQIEGGCAMGLGYALIEEYDHRKIKRAFADYLIPTSADVPEIEAVLVEDHETEGPFGAKGLGEPPAIATAPAIANAIADALGVRINSLPVTPEKILEAIKKSNAAVL